MKASVLALALLCASPVVFAQSSPSATGREANHMNNLATLLDLTDAQKVQVQAILQQERLRLVGSLAQVRYAEVVASRSP